MLRRAALGTGVCVLLAATAVPATTQLRTQVVAQGLSSPIAFVPDPTSATRFFIVQQGGLIRVLDNGVLLPTPFLDLRSVVLFNGEQGLLGMAFAPDAATSGRFYLNFTKSRAGVPSGNDIVVARFRRSPANAPTADAASRFDLIWPGGTAYIPHPNYGNHNGGHLAFGPDGYLYIGTGDGGSGNDPPNNAQNGSVLLGKMLRIDVNVADSHPTGYDVPPDNPFLDGQPVQALGEIWAFGLRNPWRYSFDDLGSGATGALVIGDVGQGAREEVNYEPFGAGGRNYGWSLREGTIPTPNIPPTRQPAYLPLTSPLFDYGRTVGRAVTGGYVYRGAQLPPAYRGRYFVSDAITSMVSSVGLTINPSTREATVVDAIDHTTELGGSLGGVVSFGRDLQGELYLVTFAGRILKIVADTTPGAPSALSALVTGRNVTLQWMPPTSGAAPTGYRLEAGSVSGASDVAVLATGATPGVTVSGVPDGTYFVRVRGDRDGVQGLPSNEVRIVVAENCTGPPAAPTGLTRTVNGTTVSLAWVPSATASGYFVDAGSASGQANLATLSVGVATQLVVPAPPGVYYVRVRGVNRCGTSAASNEVVVSVP